MPIFLSNWSIAYPCAKDTHLQGEVYGHPRYKDGTFVTTSPVEKADGVTITTRSGSVYELGKVEKNYREWLRADEPEWDPENPITLKEE